jgi:NAD(P)H-flavin reductase
MKNIYLPYIATITEIEPQTSDTALLRVEFDDPKVGIHFKYFPGQFAEVSVLEVTKALVSLYKGDRIGIRGPFGVSFPLDEAVGKDILFVAGGIGLVPLRSVINYVLDRRDDYGRIKIVYGARSPGDLCFREELKLWSDCRDVDVSLTVDKKEKDWKGHVGFVPQFLEQMNLSPENSVAFTCGPPIMIRLVIRLLEKMGYPDDRVITTLEMKMKCGVGKCGRCNIGGKYVCQDGPVFTLKQLKELPWEGKDIED